MNSGHLTGAQKVAAVHVIGWNGSCVSPPGTCPQPCLGVAPRWSAGAMPSLIPPLGLGRGQQLGRGPFPQHWSLVPTQDTWVGGGPDTGVVRPAYTA